MSKDARRGLRDSHPPGFRLRRRFWLFAALAIFFLGPALFPLSEWTGWEHARQILAAVIWSVGAAYEVGRAQPLGRITEARRRGMRFSRRRYDPWPDLLTRSDSLRSELSEKGKAGEFSADRYLAANRVVRMVFEDFSVYATMGKDRKKLGPEFADQFEEQVRRLWAMGGIDSRDVGLDDDSRPLASREDRERTWREVEPIIEPYRDSRLD